MIDNKKLIKAANSENGKLIIEHLKERMEILDLNILAEKTIDAHSHAELKAAAMARRILNNEIKLLTGEIERTDSILDYLT